MTKQRTTKRFTSRLFRMMAAFLGIAGSATGMPQNVVAQNLGYRSATAVPAAWTRFAQLLQFSFAESLSSGNETAYRLHVFLENRTVAENMPSDAVIVKAWVGQDGKVERVDFPSLHDVAADADLRNLLLETQVGEAPPKDMLQPLHLKLSLKWKS